MRKIIKDYLTKEYGNYVKDLEALTNKCRRLVRKPSSATTTAAAI